MPILDNVQKMIGGPLQKLGEGVSNMFTEKLTYTAPPRVTAPTATAVPVTPTVPITASRLVTLPSGQQIRQLPADFAHPVRVAYQKFPQVNKGLLEAILHQESSMGTNKASYNPQIGEHAWLAGLTQTAKDDISRRSGMAPDFNTQNGVIQAAAAYLSLIRDRHDKTGKAVNTITDPVELYNDYYKTESGHKLSKKQKDNFRELVDYYARSNK